MRKLIIFLAAMLLSAGTASAGSPPELRDDLKNFSGQIGVYAKNLNTGKSFYFNDNIVFPTASTSKLVVAVAVYKYLYPDATPAKKNFYDASISRMIQASDNDSFQELLDETEALHSDALTQVPSDLRLRQTQIHSEAAFDRYSYHSVTTPREMAKVLETVFRERYLGKLKSKELCEYLANTIYNDEIPRHMETRVMHKTGQLNDVMCDVGIVDDGRDQILISVYTITDQPEQYASDFIATTAAKLYNLLRRK